MANKSLNTITWYASIVVSVFFLVLALIEINVITYFPLGIVHVFGIYSALFFSIFASIFSFFSLTYSLNGRFGGALTFLTILLSTLLLASTTILLASGNPTGNANVPAVSAAFMVLLRALGVSILPPRGDLSGIREAVGSIVLSVGAGGLWLAFDPLRFPVAVSAALLLSWPFLVDGINAFADKVFQKGALAAGARDLAPAALTAIGRAGDIVIDKTALMSGPDLMVTNVMAFDNEPRTLLAVAASAEAQSSHPVALALRQLASQWRVPLKTPDRFEPTHGIGVVALLGGQTVVIGTTELLKQLKIDSFTADAIARSLEADGKTVLRVAVGGRVVGVLGLEGTLRQDAGAAGMAMRAEGLTPWLFTNDGSKTRMALADMLGLECPDETQTATTAQAASALVSGNGTSLFLTLSQDRSSLELYACTSKAPNSPDEPHPIAVSNTDDIGAFPALKALAMRREVLAGRARKLIVGLWVLGGLCGASTVVPVHATPLLFGVCLVILLGFARVGIRGRQIGRL